MIPGSRLRGREGRPGLWKTSPFPALRLPSHVVLSRYPAGAGERHLGHGRGLDRQRHQILRFQIVHVALAAGARQRLAFQRHHGEVIGQPVAGRDRVETAGKGRVLGGDAGRILALVPVVIGAGGGAERLVIGLQSRIVVA